MTRAVDSLVEKYASAFQDYLAGAGESALRCAYELGRQALLEGYGVLDMVAAYEQCLTQRGGSHRASELEPIRESFVGGSYG